MGAPNNDDRENARYFIDYLRIFFSMIKKIFGSKYVTSNMFFGELVTMQASTLQMCFSIDEKRNAWLCLKENYDKYCDNIDNVNFFCMLRWF